MDEPTSFTATLELHGRTATGLGVPIEVVERLGGGKRPAVRATLSSAGAPTRTRRRSGSWADAPCSP